MVRDPGNVSGCGQISRDGKGMRVWSGSML